MLTLKIYTKARFHCVFYHVHAKTNSPQFDDGLMKCFGRINFHDISFLLTATTTEAIYHGLSIGWNTFLNVHGEVGHLLLTPPMPLATQALSVPSRKTNKKFGALC